jgi:hypothetical protein
MVGFVISVLIVFQSPYRNSNSPNTRWPDFPQRSTAMQERYFFLLFFLVRILSFHLNRDVAVRDRVGGILASRVLAE